MKQVDAAQESLNQEIVYSYTNGIYTEVVRGEVIAPNILPYDQFYLKILVPKSLGNLIWLDIFDFSPEEFKNLTKIVEGDIKSICKNQMEKFLTRPECPVKVISSNNPEIIEEYKNVINYYSQQFAHLKKNHPEDNHEYFQNAISILKKERDDFMETSFPELSPKIPQEKSSSQEVLYSYKDGVYTEIARGQNVDKESLSSLDGIYLKISLPAIEKIDKVLLQIDFDFNEEHWFFQIIKGDITEIKADHLEKFCGHPNCQMQAIDSNNPKILDIFNNHLQNFSYLQKDHERECPEYYEELINIIKEEKQVLIKNGFPKLDEIHNVLNNIFEQINNVQKILGSVSDEQESRREIVPELFLNPNEVDDFLCKSRELGARSLKIEEKMKYYQSLGMDTNSSEVRKLIEEAEGVKMEFSTLQGSIADRIQKEPEDMQVVVVTDKGLYKEIWHEIDKDQFLNPVEIEKLMPTQFKTLNPGEEIKIIEVDKEKYLSINGLSSDVILAKDKLLKAEGKEISTLKKTQEKNKKDEPYGISKTQEKIEKIAEKENRNVFDAVFDIIKMGGLIFKDLSTSEKKKEIVTQKEETIQIVAIEQEDGSIIELKSERNPNLFLQEYELKAYAEDVSQTKGKYHLIEIPIKNYPDINQFLEKGAITKTGKEKYQRSKMKFLQQEVKKTSCKSINIEKEIKKEVVQKNTMEKKEERKESKNVHIKNVEKNKRGKQNGKR